MLEITKNSLHRDSLFKSLELENEMYILTIFYEGDYVFDFENDCMNNDMITVACKLKDVGFEIDFSPEDIWISLSYPPTYFMDEIDDVKRQLDVARETIGELKGYLKEYFRLEYGGDALV